MERLKVDLCGITLDNPVIPASGTFGYGYEFAELYDINCLGTFSFKGTTKDSRFGNPTPRIAECTAGMINAVGLQNPGVEAVIEKELPKLKPLLKQVNTHIASVKGMCLLSGAEIQHFLPPQPRQENWETAMRRAYTNALGRLTEYEKRTSDASFGPVFSILAYETKSALRTITTLCGSK